MHETALTAPPKSRHDHPQSLSTSPSSQYSHRSAAAFTSLAGILRPALYMPFTPDKLLPGTVSQDIVSFLAALGLLASNWAIHRRIQRAWLLWVALLGYLFYAYALYSFDHIYNPLYLLYIALTGLALYSLIFFFMWLDPDTVVRLDLAKTPRLAIAVYLLMLVAMFVTVWLSLIIPGIQAQQPPDGATIFVIDLAFVLPLLAIVAVMLIRHQPMGALLAPTVLIKVATLGCSVLLGTLIAPFFSQSLDWGSVGVYAVMGLGSAALAIFVLMHVVLGEHAVGNIR